MIEGMATEPYMVPASCACHRCLLLGWVEGARVTRGAEALSSDVCLPWEGRCGAGQAGEGERSGNGEDRIPRDGEGLRSAKDAGREEVGRRG